MATNILIITTRNLPKIPIGSHNTILFETIDSPIVSKYFSDLNISLKNFLKDYNDGQGVNKDVKANIRAYINACSCQECQYPILKRTVNSNFIIYVTLCLDQDQGGYGDEQCHRFLKSVLDDVRNNLRGMDGQEYNYYLLAHSTDIVCDDGSTSLNRYVNAEELFDSPNDISTNIILHIFSHEDDSIYYKNIVSVISNENISDKILNCLQQ